MRSPLASPFRGGWRNLTPMRARGRGGQNPWTPVQLGHTALYDAHLGGSTTQITDSGGNGLNALAFAASTAAPTFLAYDGTPYVWLPGVTGNGIQTPDADALDITADLDMILCVAPADWTPSSRGALAAKNSGADSNRAFMLMVNTAGTLTLIWYPLGTGASAVTATSSVATGLTDGSFAWVRATLDANNGASGYDAKFYTASGTTESEPSVWPQLGTTVTGGSTTSIAATTAPLKIGSYGTISEPFVGKVRRFILRDAIGSSTVADFDALQSTRTGFTDSTGKVWTVTYGTSGLFSAVKSTTASTAHGSVVADGSDDYATGPTSAIPTLTAGSACTLYTVCIPRSTLATNMTFFSTRSGTGAGVTLRMASATTVVADVSDGSTTATTPAVTIASGTKYVLGVVVTAGSPGTAYCFANNTAGSTVARTGNTETGGALTVLANSTPANFMRVDSRVPFASVPAALTAGQIAQLVTYHEAG